MLCLKSCRTAKPNFVVLIADDLGIGDVSSFGNNSLMTPNIDRIAKEGVLLSQHIAAASVCTPSRSALLTGRYPIRSGMASAHKNRVFFFVASKGGLPNNETTFAKTLKSDNYSTALIGKWHLGNDCETKGDHCHNPLNQGFDYFYGIPLTNLKDFGDDGQSVILSYFPHMYLTLSTISVIGLTFAFMLYIQNYRKLSFFLAILFILIPMSLVAFQKSIKIINSVLMRNNEVIEQPIRLEGITDRLINEASKFITNQVSDDKPFLLVLNFIKVHTAHFPSNRFKGKSNFGKYGDCVMEMDYGVGQILDLLEQINIKNNTFVYFSSDNGGHLEEVGPDGQQEGGSNGIFKGGKGHGAMEGGIRVPTVAMWPNVIPADSVISVATSQMDIFTTIHKIVNIPIPSDRVIDGKDILPLLTGLSLNTSPHQFLYHYCGTYLHGVRYIEDSDNVWKLYFYTPKYKSGEFKCQFVCMCFGDYVIPHNPPLLYNVAKDPAEDFLIDINSSPKYQKIYEIVLNAVELHRNSIKPVPNQFGFWNTIWRPWLQPCCNFPYCSCKE